MEDQRALIITNPQAMAPMEALKRKDVAAGLFRSGLFPNVRNEFGAFAVVQYGAELGIGPMVSLQNINIITGKPAANGQTMLALAMARGVTFTVTVETATECTIIFRRGGIEYTATYTMEDAKAAQLTGKDNWKKHPKDMLYWRAVSKGVRRIAPDAVMGLYTPDELTEGAVMDVGEVTAHVEPEPPAPPAEPEPEWATKLQLTKINAMWTDSGRPREDLYGFLTDVCARAITSGRDLTKHEAMMVIDALDAEHQGDDREAV